MVFRFGLLLVLGLSALFALSSQYDVEKMSPVGDTHPNKDSRIRCKSAPAFALAGALEVAYNKATGDHSFYVLVSILAIAGDRMIDFDFFWLRLIGNCLYSIFLLFLYCSHHNTLRIKI